MFEGITQIFYLDHLVSLISLEHGNFLDQLAVKFRQAWDKILFGGICDRFAILGTEDSVITSAKETAFDMFAADGLLSGEVQSFESVPSEEFFGKLPIPDGTNTYFDFAFPVSHAATSFMTVPWIDEDSPKFKACFCIYLFIHHLDPRLGIVEQISS